MEKIIKIKDIKNFIPSDPLYDTIKVDTHYIKGTGLIAYIQEGEYEYRPTGFTSFKYDLFSSQNKRVLILGMKRKNQKKIDEATKEFFDNNTEQDLVNFLINNIRIRIV